MPARGNIEYTQIAEDSRNGTGAWIQMYGGGTVPSPGNMAVFDVNLNVIDGGPPGSGGGGGNLVTSVFGRTGAVVGAVGDYTAAQVTNAVDATQSYTNPSWIVSIPYSKITGAPITGVGSFNGRTGAVMPMTGDYTVSMIPGAVADPTTTIGDILVRGISSIARLGVGSNGQVLTADSTQPLGVHWATPTGGGSGSQTPWLSDIQGANFSLWNTNAIEVDGGLLGNAYSSGGWRYRNANSAFMLQVTGGQGTLFNTAPAGAPGQLISFVNALTFADSGNIGVGTVSPNYKLDVAGPVNSNACYYINGNAFACSDGASGINLTNITNINGLPPGTGGGGGSGGQIEEVPVGRMDGTNTSFTLSHAPGPNALSLFLDGVLQQQGVNYTLTGNTIVYTVAPNSADWHVAVYGLGGEAFPVMSVFGRQGAVVAAAGDYTAAMVTNAVDQTQVYQNPAWIGSLDYSKITNAPAPGAGQTPWLSNIDAAGYTLDNASLIRASIYQSSPPATGVGLEMSWQSSYGQIQAFDRTLQQYRPLVIQGSPIVFMQGMLGIGTTGPQYSLDTVGDINITGQYRVNGTPLALGQNQTPWLSNIDAGQFQLNNASQINFTTSVAPIRTGYVACNSAGMTLATGAGTALSISAINPITIASNISINSSATTPAGTAYTWVVTGGITAMSIYANARVSIGLTTAPQYNLDIAGSVNVTGQYLINGTPIGAGGSQTPWTSNINAAGYSLYSAGMIGIGVASPQHAIDAIGNIVANDYIQSDSLFMLNAVYNNGWVSRNTNLSLQIVAGGSSVNVNVAPATAGAGSAISFVNAMGFTSNGHVGIGTVAPNGLFAVTPSISGTPADVNSAKQIWVGEGTNNSQYGLQLGFGTNSTYGWFSVLQSWAGGGASNLLLNPNGGAVGIATTSASAQLDVNGYIRTTSGNGVPGSGAGVEITYAAPNGYIQTYSRSAAAYQPLNLYGQPLALNSMGGMAVTCHSVLDMTGNAIINTPSGGGYNIASYYAVMTGGNVVLTGGWQGMPGCQFTVNQTGRFLVMLNAEVQSNGLNVLQTGLLINGPLVGQQTFHYVSGTMQVSQQMVVSANSGSQFTLAANLTQGGGASASVYPACTNLTAIYLGP